MRTAEWSLVGLWCVLIPAGLVAALKSPGRASGGAKSIRRVSLAVVFVGLGTLCELLPKLLGWPYGVGMALSTVALLLAAAMAVLLARNLRDFVRPAAGRPGPAGPDGGAAARNGDDIGE